MTKKRLIESTESCIANGGNNKSLKLLPMTFDEVAAIIQSGDSEKLREIIEAGRVCDINMIKDHKSLLMLACESSFIECARILLDYKADVNYTCFDESVLKCSCLSGNSNILRVIIDRGVIVTDKDLAALFDLNEIARNTEISTVLLGYIQNVNWDGSGESFLFIACKAGNATVVRALLERGARLGSVEYDPLEVASRNGHVEVVTVLLGHYTSEGPDCQERICDSLLSASNHGYVDIVRALISHSSTASTYALNNSLFQAVKGHHVEVAAALLDAGADFSALVRDVLARRRAFDYDEVWSAWIYACRQGRPDMVRLLLARGADPNPVRAIGKSPLEAALLHPEAMRVLLEHGADPNRLLYDGSTALQDLVRYKRGDYIQAITTLLGHGADPNMADPRTGETILMIAALELNVDLVKLLLEHGADVTQVNQAGRSVLDMLGRTRKYGEVVKLCTSYIDSNKPGAKQVLK